MLNIHINDGILFQELNLAIGNRLFPGIQTIQKNN